MQPNNLLKIFARKRAAYRTVFSGPESKLVLADLARFCRAMNTTYVPGDTDQSKHLEGRREVWLRIMAHLKLTDNQIWNIESPSEEFDD